MEGFKLYFQRKTFSGDVNLRTKVTLASKAANRVDVLSDVSYDLPLEHTNFITTYTEGYARCPLGKNIDNPYSLCGNLRRICDTSARIPGKTMIPTTLTTWKLSYETRNRRQNNEHHSWDAPKPRTDLLIIGKVKLRYLPDKERSKRRRQVHASPQNMGCCTGNQYRPIWNDVHCEDCPTNSEAKLNGYYCESGQ